MGRACNTRRSPLSTISSARILGAHVPKDVCLPREASHVPRKVACDGNWLGAGQPALTAWEESAEGIVAGGNEPGLPQRGEVYPEDSPW